MTLLSHLHPALFVAHGQLHMRSELEVGGEYVCIHRHLHMYK